MKSRPTSEIHTCMNHPQEIEILISDAQNWLPRIPITQIKPNAVRRCAVPASTLCTVWISIFREPIFSFMFCDLDETSANFDSLPLSPCDVPLNIFRHKSTRSSEFKSNTQLFYAKTLSKDGSGKRAAVLSTKSISPRYQRASTWAP